MAGEFDPDAFLAEPAPAAPTPAPSQETSVMPAVVKPAEEAFDPDKFLAPENTQLYGSPAQQQATFTEAMGRGFASQPVASAIEVARGVPAQDILGRQKENPISNFLGETTGFVLGSFGPGEGALLAKLAPKASLPIKMALDGFVLSAGDEASKAILQDPDQSAASAIAHVGLGTALSGALGAVPLLWSAAKSDGVAGILHLIKGDSEGVGASLAAKPGDPRINPFMKSAINVALGPSEANIDARVANLEAIRTAPEFQDVYDHILDHIQNVGDDVVAQKDILSTATKEFEKSGYEAALANQAAKAVLKDAQTQVITDVTNNAYSKAGAIANAVELLRGQVVDASQAGYELLADSGKVISLKPLYATARELQDEVFAKGSPMALQQAEAIGKYVETLGAQYGTEASAENAKSIIKGLDDLSKWNFNAAEFDKGLSPVYKQIRHTLDETLKDTVPAYRAAMKPLAEKAALLGELKNYGTEEAAVKSIQGLKATPKFINDIPKLRELENKIGIKFTHDLDSFASPNLRQMRISKLPEYAEAERAANAMAYYKHPDSFEAMEHSIKTEPEWLAAMQAKAGISGLTENTIQGKMNAVMTGKNIAARSLLEKIPGLKGMSIPEVLDLIAVRQAFEKGAGMGSRNVNLFGGAGTAIGGAIGGVSGASAGAIAGGVLGAAIDRKGPTLAARLLDKYVDSFGPLAEKAGLSEKVTRRALQFIMGTETHVSAEGLKAVADYAENVSKGMAITKKAAKAIFKKGVSAVPQEIFPEKEKVDRLDNHLKKIQKEPIQAFAFGGMVRHYMPNHAESIAKISSNAASTLNALRPRAPKLSPLDNDIQPSMASKAKYQRTLSIAQQPLMLYHHTKVGTLTPEDVGVVKNLYPKLLPQMQKEVVEAMTDHLAQGHPIHPPLRRSLSTLLEQPLDGTMYAQNMQAIIRSAVPPVPAQGAGKKAPSQSALSQINKVNSMFLTPTDRSQASKPA